PAISVPNAPARARPWSRCSRTSRRTTATTWSRTARSPSPANSAARTTSSLPATWAPAKSNQEQLYRGEGTAPQCRRGMPVLWSRAMRLLLILLVPLPALAQSCPAPLAGASKLVLVTALDMASANATLQRFNRPSPQAPWKADGGPVAALVGHNGMGWAHAFRAYAKDGEPIKVDGDKKAPAGFYRIGRPFGFQPSRL